MVKQRPRCGHENPDEANFCVNCGYNLKVQDPSGPEGEQRGLPVEGGGLHRERHYRGDSPRDTGLPSLLAPSYPISSSYLSSAYGGSWKVVNSRGFVETFFWTQGDLL
ncbi:zinc ribbon domain-containing protein [Sulfuracidifex tepidarius]|uniref:zinc ribbon domain-containing protein n=1 Tax=Sulfuracidifex tepidarius TaxID=1294262 RepID=UPI0011F1C436|nr:zinc ribbon domain-containing protein [Sulfuracidifex tepidarius]